MNATGSVDTIDCDLRLVQLNDVETLSPVFLVHPPHSIRRDSNKKLESTVRQSVCALFRHVTRTSAKSYIG